MVLDFDVEIVNNSPIPCVDVNPKTLGGITCGSLNPNSLNLSDINTVKANLFYNKLNAILKLNRDIWCLQDVRFADKKDEFERQIRVTKFGRYKLYENSTWGRGGVATLIKDTVPHKINSIHRSACQNALLLDLEIKGFRFLLCNIYGPRKTVPDFDFFEDLNNYILTLGVKFVIINGDLNAVTTGSNPTPDNLGNIECFNMASLPQAKHSKTLNDLIANNFLIDKFRVTHPNLRIYSYIPHDAGGGRPNRSRIDNILVTPPMNKYIKKVDYANLISSKCDHKPILYLLGSRAAPSQPRVDQSLLNIPNLYEVAKFSIIETFLNHSNIQDKEILNEMIARINQLSRHIQALKAFLESNKDRVGQDITDAKNELEIFENSLLEYCNAFPNFETVENFELSIDYDDMLQVVLNALKNSVIAHQSNYVKSYKKQKHDLTLELENLRKNNNFMSDRFKEVESKLLDIENTENIRIIKQTKFFDILNHEKITSAYAELLSNSNDGVSIDSICKEGDQGQNIPFTDEKSRNEFICNYYQNLLGTPYYNNDTIENFMGQYNNDPLVQQHKLSEEEKNSLEGFFTMEELDSALKSSNMKSACGMDGIGFQTLKTFWPLLKNTILRAFNKMIEKKELKGLMKFAKVKLLRKGKKCPKNIKNWRPISLLNSVYKLFSGIIDIRLRKFTNKLCHRSQKAYSNERSIHESLLNVLETLGKAKNSNVPLASVLVDFSRAFDSIGHDYIRKVLLFHNFGPFFTEIVMTTFKFRKACIVTGS